MIWGSLVRTQPFCHRKAKAETFIDRSMKIHNTLISLNSYGLRYFGTKLALHHREVPINGTIFKHKTRSDIL